MQLSPEAALGRAQPLALRARYLAGDLAACAASGGAVAVLTGAVIPQAWPGWAAMPLGMASGMVLSLPCWVVASAFLGVLEPMLQIMATGMLAGMAGAMAGGPSLSRAALGAALGFAVGVGLALLDRVLSRGSAQCP